MKYLYTLSVILVCLLLPVTACGQGQNHYQHQKDSLRELINNSEGEEILKHYIEVSNLYFSDAIANEQSLDTIIALYKACDTEAKWQKNLRYQALVKENMMKLYFNKRMYDKVVELASEQLTFTSKHKLWQHYYTVYYTLISTYEAENNFNEALKKAQLMYEHAGINNDSNGKAMSLYCIGRLYGCMQRPEEMEKALRECINVIGNDYNNGLTWLVTQAYYNLCYVLIELEKYEEGLQVAKNFETAIHEYENTAGGTITIAGNLLNNLYRDLYFKIKDYDKAEVYCHKIDSIGFQKTIMENYNIFAEIYYERRQYGKALEMCNKNIEASDKENNTYIIQGIMQKIKILCAMQNETEIYELIQEAKILSDSLNMKDINAQLDDLRTQYEVDKYIAEKQRNRNYFFFALGGCALLLIVLGIWIYLNRQIARKNRTLVGQMKELQTEQEIKNQQLLQRNTFQTPDPDAAKLCPESRKDKICLALRDLLLKEKCYHNEQFSRNSLMERLGINRHDLDDAFLFCFNMQYTEYINLLRLKDSIVLLEESDLSMREISEKVGYGTLRTFQRQFQAKYNMSPKDYRKLVKERNPVK